MSLVLIFLFLCTIPFVAFAGIVRDGLVTDVSGWTALVYQAIRWEPLCGTLGPLDSNLVNVGTYCTAAVQAYRNFTGNHIAYFDAGGTLLVNAGIGLGTSLCTCFALSDSAGQAADICWYFDPVGQYVRTWNGIPYGSYLPGGSKSLPKCGEVNVAQLQSQWSQTAIIPTFNGSVQTLQTGVETVVQTAVYTQTVVRSQTIVQENTIVQTQTYTLTPSVVPLTVKSSTVVTASNGQITTLDQSYVTTVAVLTIPSASSENPAEDHLAVGLGVGLTVPVLAALTAFMWWYWLRHKRIMQNYTSTNANNNNMNNGVNNNNNNMNNNNPNHNASQSPPYNTLGPRVPEKPPGYGYGTGYA
ncbi:hypothetical protein FRC18_000200 [Serendipita sp. 400]|nr:hypothetical protein FRC18_000200 [Serendipita sp. 400]